LKIINLFLKVKKKTTKKKRVEIRDENEEIQKSRNANT